VRLDAGEDDLCAGFAQPPFPARGDARLLRKLVKFSEVFGRGLALQTKLYEGLAVTRKPAVGIDARLVEAAELKDDLAL